MSERRIQILEAAVRVIAQDGVRGLRVEKLAAAAGVSTALIYYHFTDRAGILHAALEHINHRAVDYTERALAETDPRRRLEQVLLLELQDTDEVRETSVAWGELRASAVFNSDLRDPLHATTDSWNADIETLIRDAQDSGDLHAGIDAAAAAERLTALTEGLSERWHSGSLTLDRARELLSGAITLELGTTR
ncbi:TetR/AcrR family transcriptional regulator [Nocardia otitidiscaviarum]|uniref:TetR/AcrR family transcriptional regulator n=1 Tax=Nocardia otitidiscaviarum TaxID=1823 RepID=A0A516NMB6_9NOCA|nr:TetR/AcrR family transcriptional regulator [Nocardia otitidiscaviarum]MCP9624699.1 TetR/AcrR family transcriptional regulator [Nocardia otitidiscaviarum]QDP80046.1 TetR/AcrR family transcriptional regulator [Nocardia otitidiscaviarum]